MRLLLTLIITAFLSACSKSDQDKPMKIGVTNGPHTMIAEFVQKQAEKEGLKLQIISFDDFIQPNVALEDGDIEANIFQHRPYLEEQIKSRGYKFAVLGKTILLPLGIYSRGEIKDLDQAPKNAKILIPSDPTNSARALKLLEKAGLLELSNHVDPTIKDIGLNEKAFKIIEVEAPLLPRLLKDDADLAVINSDWIIVSGMNPKSALFREGEGSPYTNLIVVKEEDLNKPEMQKFLKIYQSPEVKAFIDETFSGAILADW